MSARIHLRNLSFNWGGHVATMLVMFFLSPYIVGKLDAVSYGIWSLLNVLTGYMGIFDIGVRTSVGRYVALYLGKKDEIGVDETIRAGFGFFSIAGGLILFVGLLLGWLFPSVFHGMSLEHYGIVRILLPMMVINVWLSTVAAIYSSVLAAHDRFDIARGVDLFVLLVRTIGTIYLLEIGWGLWGMVAALSVGNLCAVIGNRIYAGKIHPGLKSFPFLYSRKRIDELLGYGIASFFTNAAVKIIGQSDLVIVGIFSSVSDVREYSVGAMLVFYSATFITLIGDTFFPTIQRTVSGGTSGEVLHLFYRQLRVTLCFGLLIYIGFVIYAQSFISLWMLQDSFNIDSVNAAASVMVILTLSKFPTLFIQPCINLLAALGHVAFTAKITTIEALVNLVFSIIFIKVLDLGIAGVAAGTLAARLLVPTFTMPYYLFKKMEISGLMFLKSIVFPTLFSALVFLISCWMLFHYWNPKTWLLFGLQVTVAAIIWGIIGMILLLPKDIRDRSLDNFKHCVVNFIK